MKCTWGKKAWCIAAIMSLSLAGCGGGGGGGSVIVDDGSNAMVVDPYIKGAKFKEIEKSTKKVLQTSEASKEDGKFKFGKTLTVGNTLEMSDTDTGEHGKVPFKGKLKYKVTKKSKRAVEDDLIIITPLTTLVSDEIDVLNPDDAVDFDVDAAETTAEIEVVNFMNEISTDSTVTFTAADLAADPMARVSDGTVSGADAALLAANMAANTALQVLGGTTGTVDLGDAAVIATATAVATELSTVFTANASNMTAATEAAVAVTTYISENQISDAATISVVADQADAIIATLTATPEVVVVITDNGTAGSGLGTQTYESSNYLAQTYYEEGKAAYQAANSTESVAGYKLAASKFLAAAALKDTISDVAIKDKVLFFGAFATVMQLADPISDTTANGLNNFGDILDAFGLQGSLAQTTDRSHLSEIELETCTTQGVDPYTWLDCDLSLASTSPTSSDLQAFAYNKVGAQLQVAIDYLSAVTDTFGETVDDAGVIVEFDATDAKFISAVANGMLAQINFLQAYNLGAVDLDNEETLSNGTTDRDPDAFLAAYPNLGKLQDASRMTAFKTSIDAAITALEATVPALQAEIDTQENDFIKLSNTDCSWIGMSYVCNPTTYNDPVEIAAFMDDLAEAKTAMASTAANPYLVMGDGADGIAGTGDDVIEAQINLAAFFQGVDLRSKMPANFNQGAFGDMPSTLPEPTFGGILTEIGGQDPAVLNDDTDLDGSPDIFDMTYFVPGMLQGRTFSTWIYDPSTPNWNQWVFTFDPSTNAFTCAVNGNQVPPGTYTTNMNILTLDFSTAFGTGNVTQLVSTLDSGYSQDSNSFDLVTKVYSGTTLLRTTYHWMNEMM